MRVRALVVAAVAVAAMIAASVGATATRAHRMVIPSCEELLTLNEAIIAMDEPHAAVLRRAVVGSTRICDYIGAPAKSVPRHTLSVEWGPYSDARAQFTKFSRDICAVSKPACGKLATAATLRPNQKSFLGLEKALGQVGVVKQLNSPVYENNPAFAWRPSKGLTPYDEMAWVFLYIVKSGGLLQVRCIDNSASSADLPCALKAANFAETSVT